MPPSLGNPHAPEPHIKGGAGEIRQRRGREGARVGSRKGEQKPFRRRGFAEKRKVCHARGAQEGGGGVGVKSCEGEVRGEGPGRDSLG